MRLGLGDGTFGAVATYETESVWSNDVSLSDVTGDGILDMVTAGYGADTYGHVTIRIGRGDGTFDAAASYFVEDSAWAMTLGDVNNDGVLDMATGGRDSTGNWGFATVRLSAIQDGVAPLLPFDLSTMAGARQALPVFQHKLNQLSSQRGAIGAFQSRLSAAVNVLQTSSENIAAAGGRIMDADVAHESSVLTRNMLLQQAGSAVLAQANQQPALALQLLQ